MPQVGETWTKFNEYVKAEDQYKDPDKGNPNSTELARLPLNEILKRALEMADCDSLDSRTGRSLRSDGIYV